MFQLLDSSGWKTRSVFTLLDWFACNSRRYVWHRGRLSQRWGFRNWSMKPCHLVILQMEKWEGRGEKWRSQGHFPSTVLNQRVHLREKDGLNGFRFKIGTGLIWKLTLTKWKAVAGYCLLLVGNWQVFPVQEIPNILYTLFRLTKSATVNVVLFIGERKIDSGTSLLSDW